MDRMENYVVSSLELHLFFGRIMKEHALFLKVGLLPPAAGLAREAQGLLQAFDGLLGRAVALSNRVVRPSVLNSGEVVTEFTMQAERQTQRLTGTPINTALTARELALRGRSANDRTVSTALLRQVRRLNRDGLRLVERLIDYKQRLLNGVDACRLFTANYPLLIEHILREARLYRAYLLELEGMPCPSCSTPRDTELFWNRIMMEHALFIRGLLDPTEEDLISTANDFAADYKQLLESSAAAHDRMMGSHAEALTTRFRDFKQAGVEGIEACKIRSLILPLLADHVLREANHYLRLLGE